MAMNPISLNPARRTAVWKGVEVRLSRSCFAILTVLIEKGGHTATYEELHDRIVTSLAKKTKRPPDPSYIEGNVRSHVKRLRTAFGPAFTCVYNVSKLGYFYRDDDAADPVRNFTEEWISKNTVDHPLVAAGGLIQLFAEDFAREFLHRR